MHSKKTPLFDIQQKLNAKMALFAGWLMPIQYESIIAEHHWTRKSCSLFDTGHMGELIIHGSLKESNLDKVITANLKSMEIGKCSYCFMLNEKGGIIDDLIVYKLADNKWMLVVNAAPLEKDEHHLKNHIKTEVENVSEDIAKLDLQGPFSREILKELAGNDIDKLKYYHFHHFMLLGEKVLISRTGYTGELGYELYIKTEKVEELWNLLISNKRVKPAGLGARDTLRLEMGYPLYGQDLTEDTTPIEAGLEKFVDFEKEFIGKESLLKLKGSIKRKLVGFISKSRRAPRHGYKIYLNNQEIGFVSSGTFSPSLNCGIGMGYVKIDYARLGTKIFIRKDKIEIEAEIAKRPFYKEGSLRK